LAFKKKGNNFYLQLDNIGQIVNVQKSMWGNKSKIDFTLNIGIFVPEYRRAYYKFDKPTPNYPTEPDA